MSGLKCKVCGSKVDDYGYKIECTKFIGDFYVIKKCHRCKTMSTYPKPTNLRVFYDEDYDSYQKKKSFFSFIYKLAQRLNNNYKESIIKKLNVHKVLDFGSGSGEFIRHINKKGYDAWGLEPINNVKNKKIKKNMAGFKNYKFDCITAWHVLEHTEDPGGVLKKLYNKLRDNGVLVLALPNYDSYDNTFYGKDWAGFDVPRHLFHFNVPSITFLAKKVGLKLIKRKPLILDAFYVSILSERNKKSYFSTTRGVFIGLISNILSLFNKQPSSIIYILKK